MFKQAELMFLYAETGVHIGGGESLGAIDLAVQRERYTDYPVGPSSGVKGAVRDWFEKYSPPNGQKLEQKEKKIKLVFGPDNDEDNASEHAGAAAFTDARILLFPVRSMKGVFAWITCPTVLRRLQRDLAMAGKSADGFSVPDNPEKNSVAALPDSECLVDEKSGEVVLEEYVFQRDGAADAQIETIAEWLNTKALPQGEEYSYWRDRLPSHLLILRDDDFTDFVRHSTEVQARTKLNEQKTTGEGGNLFYEEFLPSDTLMYSIVLTQDVLGEKLNGEGTEEGWGNAENGLEMIRLMQDHRLQIGADESIGKGIMCVHFMNGGQNQGKGENNAKQ